MKKLSVKIVGHDYITAFENKNKKKDNEPDYTGNGVAIWEFEVKDKEEPTTTEETVK